MIYNFSQEEYIWVIDALYKGKADDKTKELYQKMKECPECLSIIRDGWISAIRLEESIEQQNEIPTMYFSQIKDLVSPSQDVVFRSDMLEKHDFVMQSQLHPAYVFYMEGKNINSELFLTIKIKPDYKKFTSLSLRNSFEQEIFYIASNDSTYNVALPAITEVALRYSLVAEDNDDRQETILYLVNL